MLTRRLESQGLSVEFSAAMVAIAGHTHVTGVVPKDGRTISADLVVMALWLPPGDQSVAGESAGTASVLCQ